MSAVRRLQESLLIRTPWKDVNIIFKLVGVKYRKIPKISPGAYIFQRPILRGLFLEGLIFGGAYLRREICVSKSIWLAQKLEVNLPFLLCFTLYLMAIFQVQAPRGLIFGGAIKRRVFCVTGLGGLYLEGLIFGILRYSTYNRV